MRLAGSPPLTRGPLSMLRLCEFALRITPAHAGTTLCVQDERHLAEDHPRSRGDHSTMRASIGSMPGSPPLTRGPRVASLHQLGRVRITPAHAGTTLDNRVYQMGYQDHPRSRGDHLGYIAYRAGGHGSPPLTRGPRDS